MYLPEQAIAWLSEKPKKVDAKVCFDSCLLWWWDDMLIFNLAQSWKGTETQKVWKGEGRKVCLNVVWMLASALTWRVVRKRGRPPKRRKTDETEDDSPSESEDDEEQSESDDSGKEEPDPSDEENEKPPAEERLGRGARTRAKASYFKFPFPITYTHLLCRLESSNNRERRIEQNLRLLKISFYFRPGYWSAETICYMI